MSRNMRKQKLPIDVNSVDKSEKIRKVETPTYCSSEVLSEIPRAVTIQSQDQSGCSSRRMTSDSVIEETRDDAYSPSGIRSNNFISQIDQIRATEMREQLAKNKLIIEQLEIKFAQALEQNKSLTKAFEAKVQMNNEIIEKQKVSWDLVATIQERTNMLNEELKLHKENIEESKKKYDNLKLNENKKKVLKKRLQDWDDEKKKVEEILTLKSNQLLIIKNECEKYKNEEIEKSKLLCEINDKRDRSVKLMEEEDEEYIGKITKKKTRVKTVEDSFKTERDKKCKLITENDEISRKINDSLSKIQSLKLVSAEHEKRVEDLKSIVETAKERVKDFDNNIDRSTSRNLETISKKDSELSVLGNQLKISKSEEKQTADELTEAISNNKELLKIEKKSVEDIEQLKDNLKEKDENQLMKIKSELIGTVEKEKELSIEIEILNEESIVINKQTFEMVKNFQTLEASEEEEIKEEAELSKELATIEAKINNKSEDISELLATKRDEKFVRVDTLNDFQIEIEKKTEEINKRKRNIRELEQELKYDESRLNSEIQHATLLSKQCKILGHNKTIALQRVKIDILNRELSDLKILVKQVDKQRQTDDATKEKEKSDAEFNELKSQLKELNDKFSATRKKNEDLENKLKDFKASFDEKKDNEEVDPSKKSTSPMRKIYTANRPPPVTPPPKPILKSNSTIKSPSKFQEVRFDLASTSQSPGNDDITGSEMIEEAEKRYRNSPGVNRPDWSSLQVPLTALEMEASPMTTISQQTGARKFFKRGKPENTNTNRFDEDPDDPYALKKV